MKQSLLLLTVFITSFLSAQNKDIDNLQSQIDANKSRIEKLQSAVDAVTTENIYLKGVLDIQKPIKEASADNTTYKAVSIKGDKENKTISVEIMVESSDYDKKFAFSKANIVDILGNSYMRSRVYTKNSDAVQYKNVPLKIKYVFTKVIDEPNFINIFEVNGAVEPIKKEDGKRFNTNFQLHDLPVDWK